MDQSTKEDFDNEKAGSFSSDGRDKPVALLPTLSFTSPNSTILKNSVIKYSDKIIAPLSAKEKKKKHDKKQKFLFAITISKNYKPLFKKILERFGHDDFNYMVFVYDGEKFDEPEFEKCEIIYEKLLKWEYAVKYLTEEKCEKYDYVFFWDEDVDFLDFNYKRFIEIMNINGLELAQPALSINSYFSWTITLRNRKYSTGRFTNFVESGPALVFSKEGKAKYWKMLDISINKWGWGHDALASKISGIKRMGIIDSETIKHTRPVTSIETTAPKEMYNLFKKYNKFEYDFFVYNSLIDIKTIQK